MSRHDWQSATDRVTVCRSCGSVRLEPTGRGTGPTYYGPAPEIDQAEIPAGREPACAAGPFTRRRLALYGRVQDLSAAAALGARRAPLQPLLFEDVA